jgi:hypothetical protein
MFYGRLRLMLECGIVIEVDTYSIFERLAEYAGFLVEV